MAGEHDEVVEELRRRMYELREARPRQEKWWMTIDRDVNWAETLKRGDCSMQPSIAAADCLFAHPFVPDDADLDALADTLVDGSAPWPFIRSTLLHFLPYMAASVLVLIASVWFLCCRRAPSASSQ